MTSKRSKWLFAPFLFAVPFLSPGIASAQHAATASSPRVSAPAIHSQPVGAHVVSARAGAGARTVPAARGAVHFNPATKSFVTGDGSFVPLQDLLNPIPGLGFDYHHLSAFNQDLGIKAVIDPVTEWKLAAANRAHRHSPHFGGSVIYLLDGGGAYQFPDDSAQADQSAQEPEQQQGQVTSDQAASQSQNEDQQTDQQADQQTGQQTGQRGYDQQAYDPAASEEQAPLPDVGQFTLVLQNGDEIEAIGFTRVKDRIVYITVDGLRRTLAVADLDSGATQRINEERGTPLQLSL
jgi:hypothetical protein